MILLLKPKLCQFINYLGYDKFGFWLGIFILTFQQFLYYLTGKIIKIRVRLNCDKIIIHITYDIIIHKKYYKNINLFM